MNNKIMEKTDNFLVEMMEERDLFVKRVNNQEWNREMRTAAEDILIAFDQMRLLISSSNIGEEKPKNKTDFINNVKKEKYSPISIAYDTNNVLKIQKK